MKYSKQSNETFKSSLETKLYKVEPEGLSSIGKAGEVCGYLNEKDAIFYSGYEYNRRLMIVEYTIPANKKMWKERSNKKLVGTKDAVVTLVVPVVKSMCA